MKKLLIFAAIAALVLASCSKSNDDNPAGQIVAKGLKMTSGYSVWIHGTGTATIDWGNGSAPQSIMLNPLPDDFGKLWDNEYKVIPPYTDFGLFYTVTFKGKNITGIDVDGFQLTELDVSKMPTLEFIGCYTNKLTELDVSKNTVLIRLECHRNQLNVAALIAVFNALPNRTGKTPNGYIKVSENPGKGGTGYAAAKAAAEAKNWQVVD